LDKNCLSLPFFHSVSLGFLGHIARTGSSQYSAAQSQQQQQQRASPATKTGIWGDWVGSFIVSDVTINRSAEFAVAQSPILLLQLI